MNEQALRDAYELFSQGGYNGSFEKFVELITNNPDALSDSYTLFTENGYAGTLDDFSGLMGVKKKEETEINTDSKSEIGISQPNTLSRNQRLNVGAGPEKDTAIERAFGKNEVTDFFGDMYRAWKTGAGQGATVDDALKVFASGSNVSEENLQDYIDAVENMDSFSPSEEMQDFSRIYEAEGKGIKGFLKGIYKNPTAAIQVALSSLRAMINPGSVAAGAAGAGTGAAIGSAGLALAPITSTVGAGAGAIFGMTGALETGLSFTEFLREELNKKGLDFTDDNIRTILEDDEAMGNITRRSLARGATISSISALTGGLAAGVGANVGKNVAMKLGTTAGRAAAGAAGIGVQAIGGGTGEALGRAAAGQEMDVAEIGFEAIGEVASPSIIGTIAGMAKVPKYEVNKEKVTEETVIDIINKSTSYLELDNTDIKITDSPLIEQALKDKKKQLLDEFTMENSLTPEQLEKASPQDIQDLVSLQNLYNKYKGEETLQGIKNAANFKQQFDNKIDAIQKQSTEEVDVSKPTADSEAVGEGDTEQQSTTGEITSEPITDSKKQAEEIETQVEDDAFSIKVPSQKEQIIELLQTEKTLSNKQAADKLGILEANVRRIFGVGTKDGVFERVTTTNPETNVVEEIPGVYTLKTPDNKNFGVIETADALTSLPRLVKDGFKFDFIYLDPPYKADSGNRNIAAFPPMTDSQFGQMVDSLKDLTVNDNAPILLQYTKSQQAPNNLQRLNYLKSLNKAGFNLAGDISEITYIPTDQAGKEAKFGGKTRRADIMIFTKSGKLNINDLPVNLSQEQGQYVVRVPVASRGKQIKKKDPKTGKIKTTYEYTGRTRKPPELLKILIKGLTEQGQAVLDPTAGTGSTLEAAVALGRDFYGIEIMEETAVMARKNVEKAAANKVETQVEEEVVEEVAPATNKIGNFDVVIEDNKVVSVTKKGKKATSSSQRNVAEKIISTGAIDVDAGQNSQNPGQTTKPRSIAINIERLKKEIKDQVTDFENLISGSGIESLFGTKFTSQSIKDYFGRSPSQMGPGFIQTWVATKENGGQNISDGFTDSNESFFDADAVASFIETNFSKKQFKGRIEGDLKSELKLEREKFTEVTGLPSQPKIVGLVANAPTQEEVQQKASEEAVKSSQEEAQKIEDDKLKEARKEGQEDIKNILQEKATRKRAQTNITQGKLGTELSTEVLQKIFSIDPKIIRSLIKSEDLPAKTLERYNALAQLIGQKKAVLIDLPTAAQIKKEADSLFNILESGIDEQIEKVGEATTKEKADAKSLKDEIINMAVKINKSLDFPSRELAQKIKNLTYKDLDLLITTTEDGDVDVKKLEQLILIKKNIDAGFVPAAANDIINLIETKKDSQSTAPKIINIAIRGLQSGLRKAIFDIGKALNIIQNGNFFEAVFKSNPKTVIDDLLGNANDTTIFEKLIRPLASAFAGFDVDRNKVLKQTIGTAEKLIAFDGKKTIERSQNEIVYDKIKIMTYLLQLEHESNPLQTDKDKSLTPAAIDFLKANIKYYIKSSPLEGNVSIKMFTDIINDYVVDGEVSLKKLKDSFSPNINKAVDLYRKGFDNLAVKTNYVSTILRRNKVNIFNNYVKHAVMYDTKNASDRLEADNLHSKKLQSFLKASTKSGSTEERTGGAKALYFDPSYALMKASDDILLDFNMTNAIRQFRMKIDELRKIEGLTPLQRQALNAIEDSMEKALTSTFDSINSDPSATQSFLSFIRRVGYEATLVSMPRAAAELSSNFLFAISANPDALMDGINNYKDVVMNVEVMLNFLNNINSTEATKLANVDELTGKFTDDQGVTKYTNATGKAAPQIKNLMSQILNFTVKPIREFTSQLSNKMLSYPDQMIGRPLYIGEFVRVFEQETGVKLTQDDIIKMSEGPGKSKYLTLEFAEAIKKAGIAADKQAIMSTTSRNPILAIEKFKRNPKANAFKQIYIEANSFMANFFAFEYTTARTAVNALFNQGSISEKQALGLLLGVTLRMSFYTILYQVLSDQFDQMFRDKEDDDMDEAQEILDLAGRSMTGSILTLLTRQTMGNVPFTAIAYGLERFNENNLGVLRSGEEYDPYKHSIVYSQLGKKDLENEDLLSNLGNVFAGPYKPFLNFADRYFNEIQRQSKSKKPQTKKQQDDLTQRMALEIGGNAGLLPFYKDIRRIILRMQYEEREKTKTGSLTKTELRKRNPRLYKKLYGPGSADARLRALRRKLESN